MNKIYVVSTPIGNLSDITLRAIEVLKSVDLILAEDTRTSSILLKKYNIETKVQSMHKFNEVKEIPKIIGYLKEKDIAIISDAGTPTINDPGQYLINRLKGEVEVITVPGANSIVSALSVSGLMFDSFAFLGFVPRSGEQLISLIQKSTTDLIIFFESSKRINKTLDKINEFNPETIVSISRELTKIYEESVTGKVSSLKDKEYRGEIVLIIKVDLNIFDEKVNNKINFLRNKGLTDSDIKKYLVDYDSQNKNNIYKFLLKTK